MPSDMQKRILRGARLATLTHWKERLGQLQDWRQWRRALRAEQGRPHKQTKLQQQLKGKVTARLRLLECQQAELVALKLEMLAGSQQG